MSALGTFALHEPQFPANTRPPTPSLPPALRANWNVKALLFPWLSKLKWNNTDFTVLPLWHYNTNIFPVYLFDVIQSTCTPITHPVPLKFRPNLDSLLSLVCPLTLLNMSLVSSKRLWKFAISNQNSNRNYIVCGCFLDGLVNWFPQSIAQYLSHIFYSYRT